MKRTFETVIKSQGRQKGEPLATPPERKPKSQYAVLDLLKQVKADEVAKAERHPLETLRDEYPVDLEYALAVVKSEGRHSMLRADGALHDRIDGRAATPRMTFTEANKVLAREGLAQVGPGECRA